MLTCTYQGQFPHDMRYVLVHLLRRVSLDQSLVLLASMFLPAGSGTRELGKRGTRENGGDL